MESYAMAHPDPARQTSVVLLYKRCVVGDMTAASYLSMDDVRSRCNFERVLFFFPLLYSKTPVCVLVYEQEINRLERLVPVV